MSGDKGIKIQKVIADAGICSRRRAEELVRQGRVTVDGRPAKLGERVFPERQEILVDGKPLKPARKVYVILNKPAGYVSSTRSQFGEKTVMELLRGIEERVYPVGRLDKDTEGLLLLTNDGEFAQRIMHPRFGIRKTYLVKTHRGIPDDVLQKMMKGALIDGKRVVPDYLMRLSARKYKITLHEGMKRVVKRFFQAFGYRVVYLYRESIGGLKLRGIPKGKWRYLSVDEVEKLLSSGNNREGR